MIPRAIPAASPAAGTPIPGMNQKGTAMRPPIHATFGTDTARTRRSDPETSHEAADMSDTSNSIGAVLDTLTQYGPLADHELSALMESLGYFYTPERVRTARCALEKVGKVNHTGGFRLTPRGRRTRVWAVSE